MARRGRTCVAEGCERKAVIGAVVCEEHRDTALGEQTDREIIKMTQRLAEMAKYEEGEEKREAVRRFKRQVARGDYAALFSSEMVTALNEEGRGYGLQQEIGMMRVGMMRLLLEEDDPSRMAHSLAKLSGALGKSMERQENWEKAARQRQSVRRYLEATGQKVPLVVEREERVERPAPVVKEEAPQASAPEEETMEFEPVAPPLPDGYPDYYVDVEEWRASSGRRDAGKHLE